MYRNFEGCTTIVTIERPHSFSRRSRATAVLGVGALAGAMILTGTVGTAAADTVSTTIPVAAYPAAVAITPDGAHSYVTNQGSGTVSVIDTATNTATPVTITVPSDAGRVAISPDGARAYVANWNGNSVSVISIDPTPTSGGSLEGLGSLDIFGSLGIFGS